MQHLTTVEFFRDDSGTRARALICNRKVEPPRCVIAYSRVYTEIRALVKSARHLRAPIKLRPANASPRGDGQPCDHGGPFDAIVRRHTPPALFPAVAEWS